MSYYHPFEKKRDIACFQKINPLAYKTLESEAKTTLNFDLEKAQSENLVHEIQMFWISKGNQNEAKHIDRLYFFTHILSIMVLYIKTHLALDVSV